MEKLEEMRVFKNTPITKEKHANKFLELIRECK